MVFELRMKISNMDQNHLHVLFVMSIVCCKWILIFISFISISLTTTCSGKSHNVLLVVVDDLRYLEETDIRLPCVENFAGKSINFKKAYAQQALCAPSRNSMLTSRRPDSLHLYDFYSYWRKTVGNFTSMPQYFKENGYKTYSVGKIFHPGLSSNNTDDFPFSWTSKPYHPPTETFKDAPVCFDRSHNELRSNLVCPVNVKKQPGNSLPDIQSLEYAINMLKTHKKYNKNPFLLAVGFYKPHIPLKFPKRYLDKIPISKVQPPKFPFKPKDLPPVAWHPWTDVRKRDDIKNLKIPFPYGQMPLKWTSKIKQSYYAAALYIDNLIGKLLSHVDLTNTIVVLTSDHGWSLGENGLWAKYSNYDVALKVPLIISVPGLQNKTIETPVELIDIFPTLVDLTGLSKGVPKCNGDNSTLCFEGESLEPLMNPTSNKKRIKKYAISQYPRPSVYPQRNSDKPRLKEIKIMGYTIKTKRYRYTEWISFNNTSFTRNWNQVYGTELYDHKLDRYESQNLYLKPKYQTVRKHLSKLLKSSIS